MKTVADAGANQALVERLVRQQQAGWKAAVPLATGK
jgi:hypothetical protein